jgi:UDP:flavonoid glycosyltransferase YjiC (YdhE family)
MTRTILFVAEAATMAHAVRCLVLLNLLDETKWEIHFAASPRVKWMLGPRDSAKLTSFVPLDSVPSQAFLDALARGESVFSEQVLTRYVKEDLRVLREVRPDVVVGDFRLSLSVSARLLKVPYIALSNGCWSPHWSPPNNRYPLPVLPATRRAPLPVVRRVFKHLQPRAFRDQCAPLNATRAEFGLAALPLDLRHVYTDADYVLYADVPEVYPEAYFPVAGNHRFVGALLWSAPRETPEDIRAFLAAEETGGPLVFVSLGSSGPAKLLPAILRALGRLPVRVVAVTSGAAAPEKVPRNARVTDFLHLEAPLRASALLVCNGGSPMTHFAAVTGTPVVAIASNMDQFMNSGAMARRGVAKVMRADRFRGSKLKKTVRKMLKKPKYKTKAAALGARFRAFPTQSVFLQVLDDAVEGL